MSIVDMNLQPIALQDPEAHPAAETLPTGLWSDEPEMENDLHLWQIMLLLQCLKSLWRDRNDYYAAGNMTVYYSPAMVKNREFRGPDFMVILGVENYPRRSWTIWEEGYKYPDFIVKILSDSTAKTDRTTKKDLYAEWGVHEYFWFDCESSEFVGHRLIDGKYQRIEANDRNHLWSETLELWLGRSNGQLRYFLPNGDLVLSPEENSDRINQKYRRVTDERDQAILRGEQTIQERDRIAQERDRLAQKLRELGVNPESL